MTITLYLVGGYVRDKIMGVPSKDVDYAVEAPSYEEMRGYMERNGYTIYQERPEYAVIRGRSPEGIDADFVLCRKDGPYSDHRHPDHTEPGTLADDLARRDFTMNAIAMTSEGVIIDPYRGQADISEKLIRAVGNPMERLTEDPLRVMRAIRFAVTRGFRIDHDLEWAMRNSFILEGLEEHTATDRIREELDRMTRADWFATMQLLTGKYAAVAGILIRKGIWFKPTTEKP